MNGPGEAATAEARVRSTLAAALGAVGGFVDGVCFLALFGLFIAHMSGNVTHVGVGAGTARWADVVAYGYPVLVFTVGVVLAASLSVWTGRRRYRSTLAVMVGLEAVLLTLVVVVGELVDPRGAQLERNSPAFFLLVALAVVPMAVQSVVLRRVGAVEVHTTFITGMAVQVGVQAARMMHTRDDDRHQAWSRFLLSGSVLACYLAGATAGAWAEGRFGYRALVVPAAVAVAVAVASAVRRLSADPVF